MMKRKNYKYVALAVLVSVVVFTPVSGVLFDKIVAPTAYSAFFKVTESPYGLEETTARIQANIQELSHKGWRLSGLRSPSKAVEAAGGNVLPVFLVEACSTDYSRPLLKLDRTRILSIMMPCTITVYKNDDGKIYIGQLNAEVMKLFFGAEAAPILQAVADDQAEMIKWKEREVPPPLIRTRPGGTGGSGDEDTGGC